MTLHPAKALFRELFWKAASPDNTQLPAYFVGRNVFHAECIKRGIDCPEGFIAACQWEEKIGMQRFVKAEIKKWKNRRLP